MGPSCANCGEDPEDTDNYYYYFLIFPNFKFDIGTWNLIREICGFSLILTIWMLFIDN